MRRGILSLSLVVLVGLGTWALPAAPAGAQMPSGGPGALRFADEFNDTHAGNQMGADSDKWSAAYPWTRVHNYPAFIRDENIRVNGGNNGLLQLRGKRESFGGQPFTSGAVNSNGHLSFGLTGRAGYMEARMKMPDFLDAWPAFWSLQEGWPPAPEPAALTALLPVAALTLRRRRRNSTATGGRPV